MVVIMVHWLIRKGREHAFEARWREMRVDARSGLFREILTTIDESPEDDKFHTFSIGDPHYATYVNIGVWESLLHFDRAIGKYMPHASMVEEAGRKIYRIELEEFEFKLRERIVLKVITDRGGPLPPAELPE